MVLPEFGAQDGHNPEQGSDSVGAAIRHRRADLGLTLQRLAELVGCAKSYLSAIETGKRDHPPSEELLGKLEGALGLPPGALVEVAQWQETPRKVKQEVARLKSRDAATRKLLETLEKARSGKSLDELYRSGDLKKMIDAVSPEEGASPSAVKVVLPLEIPLINSVAAGYPKEFTDLGYPARVADEYVRSPDISDPDAFAARVVGDSMEPEYREGDIVVFSPARPVKSGMDCFARLERDAETTFKRVYFEKGEGELIRLQPLNSRYAARVVTREEVAGLYAAVSVTRGV
jgi:repressor LexA